MSAEDPSDRDQRPLIEWNRERKKRGLPEAPVPDPVTTSLEPAEGCKHGRVLIDSAKRSVSCRECNEVLDPLFVLAQFAEREREFASRSRNQQAILEAKRRELESKIEHLEKQRVRLRNQLSRDQLTRDLASMEARLREYVDKANHWQAEYVKLARKQQMKGKTP